MNLLTPALLITQVLTIMLGFFVYLNNRHRLVNKQFLILSVHLTSWAFCVLRVIETSNPDHANFWIRGAFAVTAFFPANFTLLMSSIKYNQLSWFTLYKKLYLHLLLGLIAALLTLTPFFMNGVIIPDLVHPGLSEVPEAIYGPGYYLYVVYFILTCGYAGKNFYHIFRGSVGLVRYELQFILYGFGATFLVGAFSSLILPILIGTNKTSQFGPLGIILLDGIVAYGITTRKILGIAAILQRATAYLLLFAYLIFVYFIIWKGAAFILAAFPNHLDSLPHFIAAAAVAFSMVPVQSRFQLVANKLISTGTMDVPQTMKNASMIFQSVATMDALLSRFSDLIIRATHARQVRIYIRNGNRFELQNSKAKQTEFINSDNPVCTQLAAANKVINRDELKRSKRDPEKNLVEQSLEEIDANMALGIYSKSNFTGILLLDERTDGRIYDRTEQDAIQILCNQFAVALENAQLYTAVQDSKIQNEIMLDRLVSGVIVANPDRDITLFNHEAQVITGINDEVAVGQNIAVLPREIYLALEVTLENRNGIRNIDATLHPQSDPDEMSKNIRMSSAFLFGHDGKPMGALLVFTDITELKALEEQVRRSDQLSSVGTLAAGMAHEIKNPLVTIKTFTQLLPQRYADDDFRNDFSSLVAHEVSRIDGIVNELLSFSKPTKPHLIQMDLQDTIDQTLKLIHEQLSQKNIALQNNCRAKQTLIFGDSKLLSQALINLTLNAIEAINENGTITVGTLNCSYRFANGDTPDMATRRKCLRLQISDTGKGIERENLQKIFDPFYTNKSEGTGMGLSVAHGIISEHHSVIEVESEPGRGTTFFIYFPLVEEGAVS